MEYSEKTRRLGAIVFVLISIPLMFLVFYGLDWRSDPVILISLLIYLIVDFYSLFLIFKKFGSSDPFKKLMTSKIFWTPIIIAFFASVIVTAPDTESGIARAFKYAAIGGAGMWGSGYFARRKKK